MKKEYWAIFKTFIVFTYLFCDALGHILEKSVVDLIANKQTLLPGLNINFGLNANWVYKDVLML